MEENLGVGTAEDATVRTDLEVPVADPKADAERLVAAAQARVERQKQHLAGAEEFLARAQADLDALNGGAA